MSGEMSVKQRRRMHITVPAITYNEAYWAEECYKMCDRRFLRSVAAMKSELPIVQYLNYMKNRFTCISLMKKCYLRLKQIDYNYANRIFRVNALWEFARNEYLKIINGFEKEALCVDMFENCYLIKGIPDRRMKFGLGSINRSGDKEPVIKVHGYNNLYALIRNSVVYIYKWNFAGRQYSRIHYINIQEYVTKSFGPAKLDKLIVDFCNEFCVVLIESIRKEKFLAVFNLETGTEVRLQRISNQFPGNAICTAMSIPPFTNIANVIVLNVHYKEEEDDEETKGLILMWDITKPATEIKHLISPPTINSCVFIDIDTYITYTFVNQVFLSVYEKTTYLRRVIKVMLLTELDYSSVQVFGDRFGFVGDKMSVYILNKDTLETLLYIHNDWKKRLPFAILPCNLYAYYDNGIVFHRFGDTDKGWTKCKYEDVRIVKSHCPLKMFILRNEVYLKQESFILMLSTFTLL